MGLRTFFTAADASAHRLDTGNCWSSPGNGNALFDGDAARGTCYTFTGLSAYEPRGTGQQSDLVMVNHVDNDHMNCTDFFDIYLCAEIDPGHCEPADSVTTVIGHP